MLSVHSSIISGNHPQRSFSDIRPLQTRIKVRRLVGVSPLPYWTGCGVAIKFRRHVGKRYHILNSCHQMFLVLSIEDAQLHVVEGLEY
jgi:hypothetical protein